MPNDLFIVDTSAWILALRKDFLPEVKDRIEYLLKENSLMTDAIVVHADSHFDLMFCNLTKMI